MLTGAVVSYAGPRLALAAARDLIVPGERLGLGFQQPIRHLALLVHASARNGLASSDSIAASMSRRPASTVATAAAIGISMPRSFAMSFSTEAVNIPSTSLPRSASSGDRPSPSPM